ncbi:MAG: hypothetical protein IKP12_00660 [Acholeplasmatales bacterium]|nr:hypothetical protein [Acholeplasmatales bacterium]
MKKVFRLVFVFIILLLSSCSKELNNKEQESLRSIIEECDYEKNRYYRFLYSDGSTKTFTYLSDDTDNYYFYINEDKYLYNKETSEISKNDASIGFFKCNKKIDFINYVMDITDEIVTVLTFEDLYPFVKDAFNSNQIIRGRSRGEYDYKKSHYYSVEIDIDTLKKVSWYDKFEIFSYKSLDEYSNEKISISIRASIPDRMVDSFVEISINNSDLLYI